MSSLDWLTVFPLVSQLMFFILKMIIKKKNKTKQTPLLLLRDSQFHGHDLGVHSWKEVQEKALKSNEVTRPAEKKND